MKNNKIFLDVIAIVILTVLGIILIKLKFYPDWAGLPMRPIAFYSEKSKQKTESVLLGIKSRLSTKRQGIYHRGRQTEPVTTNSIFRKRSDPIFYHSPVNNWSFLHLGYI